MADIGYRPLGFESDIGNQNFAGATNPDRMLHAEFYYHEMDDTNQTYEKSMQAGKLVRVKGPKTIYIRIMRPGDQTSIIETPARKEHEVRFPDQWRWFQMAEGLLDGGQDVPGWKLEDWEDLSKDEVHKLKFLRFYTVEHLAMASDAQLQQVMGGPGIRLRAQEALKSRTKAAFAGEMADKDKQIAEMQAQLAELAKTVKKLSKDKDI